MILQKAYGQFLISIFDDPSYDPNSVDNLKKYSNIYSDKESDYLYHSKHAIELFDNGQMINSALVMSSGGATGVHDTCAVICKNSILICCGDSIFCLSIPGLNLCWQIKTSAATCYEVFEYKGDYFVHGELEIICLDFDGTIKWNFSGTDIFTTPTGKDTFKIMDDIIYATNWDNVTFELDAKTGATLNYTAIKSKYS